MLKSTKKFRDPKITSINSLFRHMFLIKSTNQKKVELVISLSDKVEVRATGIKRGPGGLSLMPKTTMQYKGASFEYLCSLI